MEASGGRRHHHLAPTSTPGRERTAGASIASNCKGGSLPTVCVFVNGYM